MSALATARSQTTAANNGGVGNSAGSLRIRATRHDTLVAGTTVTAAFMVSSQRDEGVQVMPHVEMPAEWTVLMGGSSFVLAPRASELLMLSVAVPSRMPAGVYAVRVWVTSPQDPRGTMDSIVVAVPARRELAIDALDRPGFVISGKSYSVGFLLRNRGNSATTVHLVARSSLGTASMADTQVQLAADASRVVRALVQTPAGLQTATDDVLEVFAAQAPTEAATPAPSRAAVISIAQAASSQTASAAAAVTRPELEASARVTVVPEPNRNIDEYLRVPTQLHLRAGSSSGVSPFDIYGRGKVIDGGATELEFLFRGPTGNYSAFGERDEYRVDVFAASYHARVGDHLFMLSSLTGFAQPGFGVGADGRHGAFSFGGYSQQFRRLPEKGSETGAFLAASPIRNGRVALNFVNRLGGFLPGRIGSASMGLTRPSFDLQLEEARSQATSGNGTAHTVRLSGATPFLSYDMAHLYADTAYAGPQRGSEHDFLIASARAMPDLSFALSASSHRTNFARFTTVPYADRLDIGTLGATAFERYTIDLVAVTRSSTTPGQPLGGRQHGARLRADQNFADATLSLESEGGRAHDELGLWRTYGELSVGGRRAFSRGVVGLWTDRYSGGSITKGNAGTLTTGGDASLQVTASTQLMFIGYATRVQGDISGWHTQLDAQIAYSLPSGNTVSLRTRLIGGAVLGSADQSVAYLEYGMPMGLPVSRLRTPGRVYGRVVDAVTGQGVPGALVRLGPQAAITDKQGRVAFGGVPAGEHRLSMSQEVALGNAVFVGDPTVVVDSTHTQPTRFELAIGRGARIEIQVRRFVVARTGVAGAADSLADAGAVADVPLVLAGERDTLFSTTNDKGGVTFTDIPAGKWIILVRGDAPAFHRFDPDRLELAIAPGNVKEITFRLVPRKREVQLIGDGIELKATVGDPKAKAAPRVTPPVKPPR